MKKKRIDKGEKKQKTQKIIAVKCRKEDFKNN